jgi:8-oxo-dGTP pyrophosphatase MutT (NUDIX family)
VTVPVLDEHSLRNRAATRLHRHPPALASRSDFDLNPGLLEELGGHGQTVPAAVLVPIVTRPSGLTVLLTQRTEHLAKHSGQVAFPGGKVDADDADALAAALRETEEEIGIVPGAIEPIGFLDIYRTGTGFTISPAVGLLVEGYTLSLNQAEVADAFEVPLAFLLDPANHQRQSREWRGRTRHFYAMPYAGRNIWGVTAGIIRNLYERLMLP